MGRIRHPIRNAGALARRAALEALLHLDRRGVLPPRARLPDPREEAFSTKLVKGVLRHRTLLDRAVGPLLSRAAPRLDPDVRQVLRLGAYELLFLEKPPHAAVSESVNLIKRRKRSAASLVNAVLRRMAAAPRSLPRKGTLSDALPEELASAWTKRLGPERAARAAAALLSEPPLAIRVNRLKTAPEELARSLALLGASVEPSRVVPGAFLLRGAPPLSVLAGFRDGHFCVQNEAAQLAAFLLDPRPQDAVLDAAAAPGGKATQMAEMTACRAAIVALDRSREGVRKIGENVSRLGLSNVRVAREDFLKPARKWSPFDRILIDAPCSGWGVLRAHPEWRWFKRAADPRRMARTQRRMLERGFELLKPGGVLVYGVCTFSGEETEELVARLLAERGGLRLEDPRPYLPEGARRYAGARFLQTYPGDGDLDGFFLARFRKG